MFHCEEAERRRDHRIMENFYYECLYDILRNADTNGANLPALNRIKAKIVQLRSHKLITILVGNTEADRFKGEQPTLYHFIQRQKRRIARTVRSVRDGNGLIQTSPKGTAHAFTTYLRTKYDKIEVDDDCVSTMTETARVERPTAYEDSAENPFDPMEICNAIQTGGRNRAPGRDGIGIEFYKANWEIIRDDLCTIFNNIFFGGTISPPNKNMGQ